MLKKRSENDSQASLHVVRALKIFFRRLMFGDRSAESVYILGPRIRPADTTTCFRAYVVIGREGWLLNGFIQNGFTIPYLPVGNKKRLGNTDNDCRLFGGRKE